MTEPFEAANLRFETWLRGRCEVVEADLGHKHERMRASPFLFLRCTFFRWAETIEALLPDLARGPVAPSVGDSHLENFGSWRDAEGRLVWGMNDFDEAGDMPWAFDLVRLVTSARLSPAWAPGGKAVAEVVERGYRAGLADPAPFILDERWSWLGEAVRPTAEHRADFWQGVDKLAQTRRGKDHPPPDATVQALLRKALPADAGEPWFQPRRAGGGSLGRARFVAVADWRGGRIIREAKALVPSAWDWAHGRPDAPSPWAAVIAGRLAAPDPFMGVEDGWLIRRLAPDNRKIELEAEAAASLTPAQPVPGRLSSDSLAAMGQALGAFHAGGEDGKRRAKAIAADLRKRPAGWLRAAAKQAEAAVMADYEAWRA